MYFLYVPTNLIKNGLEDKQRTGRSNDGQRLSSKQRIYHSTDGSRQQRLHGTLQENSECLRRLCKMYNKTKTLRGQISF